MPEKQTTQLYVEVEFDPAITDAESLATVLDRLMEMALSTPDILADYGNPAVKEFSVAAARPNDQSDAQSADDLVKAAERLGLDAEQLDELVHEQYGQIAAAINNEGLEAQLGFLAGRLGAKAVEDELRDLAKTRR
ncbi:MAG TPA: hypothetical protein VHC22_02075 [Pirellulales bacterium]|nr:hypothetical protein [Pirellulales bacterium]